MRSVEVLDSLTLDRLERQIVRCLQLQPRAPFSAIASVLDVSEQTVARRYRQLRNDGLVRVIGAVNPRALGLHDWMLRLRCRPEGTQALGLALAKREDVSWVSVSAGGSEIVCALRARSQAESDDLLGRLPATAPVLELSAVVILNHFVGSDPRDWPGVRDALSAEQTAQMVTSAAPVESDSAPEPFDATDHALLDCLLRDGRTSYAVLARTCGLTEARVTRRIAALQASGALYFDLDLATAALGSPTNAYLWLTVPPGRLDALGRELASYDNVHFAAAITGPTNLIASVTCAGMDELYQFVTQQLGGLDGVQSVEISPVLRRLKQAGALTDGERLAAPAPLRRRATAAAGPVAVLSGGAGGTAVRRT